MTESTLRLTNESAGHNTISAWRFYHRVRDQFSDWNSVILTVPGEPEGLRRVFPGTLKLVVFIDDRGNRLDLYGINYGYGGGKDENTTPGRLLDVLVKEGFGPHVADVVFNGNGNTQYPVRLWRD